MERGAESGKRGREWKEGPIVRVCSTIVKHETSELQIQNRSTTTLCAKSTNVVLSYVKRIPQNGQSLSIVGHPLQQ